MNKKLGERDAVGILQIVPTRQHIEASGILFDLMFVVDGIEVLDTDLGEPSSSFPLAYPFRCTIL